MEGQCKLKATSCHPFKSDNKTAGAWQFNFTETLGSNEYCKIEVDATAYIARVVLDDSVSLSALSGSKEIKATSPSGCTPATWTSPTHRRSSTT